MTDIRLVQSGVYPYQSEVSVDWALLKNGALDETESLATAVIVALGTDRLAERTDILPDLDSTDRRGWWGDYDAEQIWNGWPIGTRLWLVKRDKITGAEAQRGALTTRIESYIREAIRPFIERSIASNFDVKVERIGLERITALVRLYRGPELAVELRYQALWADIIES